MKAPAPRGASPLTTKEPLVYQQRKCRYPCCERGLAPDGHRHLHRSHRLTHYGVEASSLTTKESLLFGKENVDTRAVRCGRGLAPDSHRHLHRSHRLTHNGVVSGLAPRGAVRSPLNSRLKPPCMQRRSVTVTKSEMMHLAICAFSRRVISLSLPQQTETFHACGRSHLVEYLPHPRQRCLISTCAWGSNARRWITRAIPHKNRNNAEPSPRRIVIYSE